MSRALGIRFGDSWMKQRSSLQDLLRPLMRERLGISTLAVLVAGVAFLPTLRFIWQHFRVVRGWEAEAIAQSIISGHGFSFPGTERWLWEKWNGDPNAFFPTAWVDPVFTYILAGAHWLFGRYAFAAMYGLNLACIATIIVCVYRITVRFGGVWAGTLAVLLIAANAALGRSFFDDISNSALAAATIAVTALVCVRYFERPVVSRLVAMGVAIGVMVLTCPAVFYFPLSLTVVLAIFHRQRDRWLHPALMLLCAGLIIAPWTLRNYFTFNEFVPVRDGGGQIAWDGTVGAAETFIPGAAKSPLPPPWRSANPREAVGAMMHKEQRVPMHRYQVESVMAAPVPGYKEMNEAQRDKFYLSRTLEFVSNHPGVAAEMAVIKVGIFSTRFGAYGVGVLLLALATAVLCARDRRTWSLSLLALSYGLPFTLVICYYGRYRAPIEPVLCALAAVGLTAVLRRGFAGSQALAT